jgi:biotin carboxylase
MLPSVPRVALLLPSASYRAPDFVEAARRLGVEVVVVSDARQTWATAEDADRALVVDFGRPEEAAAVLVETAGRSSLDAVVAVDEPGVAVAALAGERLGLAHNPPAAVAATRDKTIMRRRLAAAGTVPQPAFAVVDNAGRAADVVAAADSVGWPCVVKAVSLSGSRGVLRADDAAAAVAAAARIRALLTAAGDPAGPLLVERFVPGAELAVEGLLVDGQLHVLALFDKPDPLDGPVFEETMFVTPSRQPSEVQQRIADVVAEAVRALGLREGPVHAEVRVDGADIWFLEVAARSIGGLCARTLQFGLGTTLEELILRHAVGRLPDRAHRFRRERSAAGVWMVPIPRAGTLVGITGVDGVDGARAVEGIVGFEQTIPDGRRVRPLPEGDRYLAFLFARGKTPAAVERALRTAADRIEVEIAPCTSS